MVVNRATWFPVAPAAAFSPAPKETPRWSQSSALIVPDSLKYPTHVIVPNTADGLVLGGLPQPLGLVDVGLGLAHAPVNYLGSMVASLDSGAGSPTPPSFDVSLDSGTLSWGNKLVSVGAFLNAATLTAATDVVVESGSVRKCRKRDGTYTNGRWRTYYQTVAGSNGVRIQHNMRIPTTDPPSAASINETTDLGFELVGDFGTLLTSSLGTGVSGYNADINGQWTGWVAGNGIFVSIRGVALQWPRGFLLDPVTGKLRLYIHFENGERVRAGDYDYDSIAHLNYLHQGKLNLYMPQEYRDACKTGVGTDAQLVAEMNGDGDNIDSNRSYPCNHAGQTLEILVAFYDPANGLPDFAAWHSVHEAGPVISLVTVEGQKGTDFPEIEAIIRRDILSYAQEYHGQWLDGDFRENPTTLHRCRTPNHYRWCSSTLKEFLRTRDQAILQQGRRFMRYYRDMACWDPASVTGLGDNQLGFSHGKALLPWQEIRSQGHWIDPTSLLYAWQVDGDRVSKDKYDLWNPTTWETGANREVKNTLVHARIKKDYLGQDYSALEGMRASVESKTIQTYIDESSAGVIWHPYWETDAYGAATPVIQRNIENIWSLVPSILSGESTIHHEWLGRLSVDSPNAELPGPVGEGYLAEQWGTYLQHLRDTAVTSLPFVPFMGTYPQKLVDYRGVSPYSSVICFSKTSSDPLTILFGMQSFENDIMATLIRVKRPDGTFRTLQQNFPYYATGTLWDEEIYEWPSGAQGLAKNLVIEGPAGDYQLFISTYEGSVFGPFTDGPEYSVVQAGARSGRVEGWFRPTGGSPVAISNLTSPYVIEDSLDGVYLWPYGGTFAQELEWLPADTPTITAPSVPTLRTSTGLYVSFNKEMTQDEVTIAQLGGSGTPLTMVGTPERVIGGGPLNGHCARFTRGSGHRFTRANHANFPKGDVDFTISGYVKPGIMPASSEQIIVCKGDSTLQEWVLVLVTEGDGTGYYAFRVTDGSGNLGEIVGFFTTLPVVGTWNHVICWHDKTLNTLNLTVDGVDAGTTPWTAGTRNGTGSLAIGDYPDAPGTRSFGGDLAELGIWNKVASATERTALVHNTWTF